MLELALVENIQRADLNPLEEATAYRELMNDFGLTQEQVAAKVGKDRTTVANALRLLRLPEEIRTALADGTISEGHARALLTISDEQQQQALLRTTITNGYSVRQTEEAARRIFRASPGSNPACPKRAGRRQASRTGDAGPRPAPSRRIFAAPWAPRSRSFARGKGARSSSIFTRKKSCRRFTKRSSATGARSGQADGAGTRTNLRTYRREKPKGIALWVLSVDNSSRARDPLYRSGGGTYKDAGGKNCSRSCVQKENVAGYEFMFVAST